MSKVGDMSDMFHNASSFNQDISGWKLKGDKFKPRKLWHMLRTDSLDGGMRKKIESKWSLSDRQKNEALLWLRSSLVFGHSVRRLARGRVMI